MATLAGWAQRSVRGPLGQMVASLHRWRVGLALWSLVDQGIVSLGTFLLGLLLARSLAPPEYGVYALIWGALLFLRGFHTSLVTYPLSVVWAKTDREKRRVLVGGSLVLTVALSLPLIAVVLLATVVIGRPTLAPWAVAALLAGHFQETTRRVLMAGLRHSATIPGDIVSYLGQVVAVWTIASVWRVSVEIAFIVMALTSLLAALIQLGQLGAPALAGGELAALVVRYWRLGQWLVLATLLSVFLTQAFPWVLGLMHGADEVARYQAAANLVFATHPLIFGLGNLLVPAVAQAQAVGGWDASRRVVHSYGALGAVLMGPYLGLLWLWPAGVLRLVYGADSSYVGLATEVRLFALAYMILYVNQLVGSLLLGLEQSRASFWSNLVGAAASILAGIPLAASHGVGGALVGLSVSRLVQLGMLMTLLRRLRVTLDVQRSDTANR